MFAPGASMDRLAFYQRAITASHEITPRVEVWSQGAMLTESAQFLDGGVTDEWKQGVRRHLDLVVPPTTQWLRWLDKPDLQVHAFSGVRHSRRSADEFPLGVFLVKKPKLQLESAAITIAADDLFQKVDTADFGVTVWRPPGLIRDTIWWYLVPAGLAAPVVTATSQAATGPVLLEEKSRTQNAVADAKSIGAELWTDRYGTPFLVDAVGWGTPTSTALTGDGGTAVGVGIEPDWSKVYNRVSVTSSASDVELEPVEHTIEWAAHPAHPQNLGYIRTYHFASPLIRTRDQQELAAATTLPRVSTAAVTHSYECIPDLSRDAGDTMTGATQWGATQTSQIQSVFHPLAAGKLGRVVSASTQVTP